MSRARNKICNKVVDIEAKTVTFKFADGTTHTIAISDIPENVMVQATLHGLSQKLGDSYCSAESITQAIASFTATKTNLCNGVWNLGKSSTGGIWAEALARATGNPLADAIEAYAAMSKEEQAALRKHPHVKAAKLAIDKERLDRETGANPDADKSDLMKLFD